MSKSATIQVRVEPFLKEQVDVILKKIGTTGSQVINALYAQIVMRRGLPFELKIPNQATLDAIEELESGGGKSFATFREMIDDMDDDNA